MQALLETASWQPLLAALVTFCSLLSTLLVSRTNRWLRVLLERERLASEKQIEEIHARELKRHNETLRTLCATSEQGERVTLESLLSDEQADFSLESSHEPSVANQNSEFIPPAPISRASGSRQAEDWDDAEERTTRRTPPGYRSSWPAGNKP